MITFFIGMGAGVLFVFAYQYLRAVKPVPPKKVWRLPRCRSTYPCEWKDWRHNG